MNDPRPETRGQEHEIRIDAPAEAVWRAISEAEELTRWYVESAEVEPRLGGAYKISWGEGMDGTSKIIAWEPGARLKLEHQPAEVEFFVFEQAAWPLHVDGEVEPVDALQGAALAFHLRLRRRRRRRDAAKQEDQGKDEAGMRCHGVLRIG